MRDQAKTLNPLEGTAGRVPARADTESADWPGAQLLHRIPEVMAILSTSRS